VVLQGLAGYPNPVVRMDILAAISLKREVDQFYPPGDYFDALKFIGQIIQITNLVGPNQLFEN
jgi:hypothetical protein